MRSRKDWTAAPLADPGATLQELTYAVSDSGHVALEPGVFQISDTLVFGADDCWIEGCGAEATIIKAAPGFPAGHDLIKMAHSFQGLRGVLLDGNNLAQDCLSVQSSQRTWVSDLYIQNAGRHGIALSASASSGNYRDIKVKSCAQRGLWITSGTDNEFASLWIGQCGTGARIETGNNTLQQAHIWGNTGAGVEVRSGELRFNACYIETNGTHGFDCFNVVGVLITGCNIWKNTSNGINVNTMQRMGITGNAIHANGNGISASSSSLLSIMGNHCWDEQGVKTQVNGILLAGTCDACIVTNNVSRTADHVTAGISSTATNSTTTPNIT